MTSSECIANVQPLRIIAQVAATFLLIRKISDTETTRKQHGWQTLGEQSVICLTELNQLIVFLAFYRNKYHSFVL